MDAGQVSSQRGDGKKSAGKEAGKQQVLDARAAQHTGARRPSVPKRDAAPRQDGAAKRDGAVKRDTGPWPDGQPGQDGGPAGQDGGQPSQDGGPAREAGPAGPGAEGELLPDRYLDREESWLHFS
jgi:hypothetical protein